MAKAKKAKRTAKKTKPSNDGRNRSGQFAAGNKLSTGSTGHKCLSDAKQLKQALTASVSIQDIKNIGKALLRKALTGDTAATKELFDRLWGKAPQAITGEDGGAIQMQIIDYASLHIDK